MGGISFIIEYPKTELIRKNELKKWIESVIQSEGKRKGSITFLFSDDEQVAQLNQSFLAHKTLTDILTFDYSLDQCISGDVIISVERVNENAKTFKTDPYTELLRVMVHGVLHLCGHKDKSHDEKEKMRKTEEKYLELYFSSFT